MCLRGSACIYQGEELGLPEADVAFEDLQDPYGIEFWPEFKGRDGCRTPMVWEASNSNGGFSAGKPWLPVEAAHLNRSVAAQENEADAILHHYRRAIGFRKSNSVLARGAQGGADTLFCAFNMGDAGAEVTLPEGTWLQAAADLGGAAPADGKAALGPWQVCILRKG
jgi:alpha-glucosidase